MTMRSHAARAMTSLAWRRWILAAIGAPLVAGCFSYGPPATRIRVRDPSSVSLASLDDPNDVLAPAGSSGIRKTLGTGVLHGDYHRAAVSVPFRIEALRTSDGGVSLEGSTDQSTDPPVSGSADAKLVSAAGLLFPESLRPMGRYLLGPSAPLLRSELGAPELSLPVCGRLVLSQLRHSLEPRFESTPDCDDEPSAYRERLSTPWSNVIDVTEVRLIQHDSALPAVDPIVGAIISGILGGLLFGLGAGEHEDIGFRDVALTLGGAGLAAGVAFGVYTVALVLAPKEQVTVVFPAAAGGSTGRGTRAP